MSKKDYLHYKANFDDFSVLIPWKDFVKIMNKEYGFEMINKRGSVRAFVNGEIIFTAHEPHKREPYLSKTCRTNAIAAIKKIEILKKLEAENEKEKNKS